jgi:hypothetical protein
MTYAEIEEKDPEEFAMRKKNKLGYRYPRCVCACVRACVCFVCVCVCRARSTSYCYPRCVCVRACVSGKKNKLGYRACVCVCAYVRVGQEEQARLPLPPVRRSTRRRTDCCGPYRRARYFARAGRPERPNIIIIRTRWMRGVEAGHGQVVRRAVKAWRAVKGSVHEVVDRLLGKAWRGSWSYWASAAGVLVSPRLCIECRCGE